ncbi:E motif [Dillenia turbinata]|uniref:E motif n=1 Tax=Dillenia turbinata TaxID=194707 RepID=A0AAN8WEN0_9MAGN
MRFFTSILRTPLFSFVKSISFLRPYHNYSPALLDKCKHLKQLNQILSQTIVTGLFHSDPFVSSKLLLNSLSNCFHQDDPLGFSHTLFLQIPKPNIFAWNFMFRAYSNSSCPTECLMLYNLMRHTQILPDNYTFPFILKACARLSLLEKGREIHAVSLNLGLEVDVFVQNALISMYSLCGMVETAHTVFNALPVLVRDVVSWNSIISGCMQTHAHYGKALKLFGGLLGDNNVRPNEVSIASALSACAKLSSLDLGKKIHAFMITGGFKLDVFISSSLVDMYAKCGQTDDAQNVFDRIPDKNVVCWTAMIACYVQSDLYKEAIELFREMQLARVTADSATVACVISACGHLGALDQGRWIHGYCERKGIEMNLSVWNALIDMYSKCGDLNKAFENFHFLTQKDVFTWTVMITGLAMNGESDQALQLFSQMEVSNSVRPNDVTFLGVLSACSHGGLVEKGSHYFEVMSQKYNLTPRIEHYGCMVDLLGRANLLVEAQKFISAMPIEPDVVIWRSLLFASWCHRNIDLAEFAANQIEELEPRRCGARVLLANAYAATSRWNDVKRVRKAMDEQSIEKQPGCSFVEVNGVIREFLVDDFSHGRRDEILDIVTRINNILQHVQVDPDI